MTRKKRSTVKLDTKNIPIENSQIELVLRQKPTKDLVAFDFGLLFTEGTKEVQIYVDDMLRESLNGLLKIHGKVILKVNVFSPDVMLITPADDDVIDASVSS